ncbi:MAG: hypothetical protein FJX77_09070 [Armatimonadetes bacterium]|nr:hypothetical protein [Armatimonadota bacterium]
MNASALLVLLALAGTPVGCSVAPGRDTLFTSTRRSTGIVVRPDGTVWAGTPGGLLHHPPNGRWEKLTESDGLPSHEVQALRVEQGELVVVFPTALARRRGDAWRVEPRPDPGSPAPRPEAAWRGQIWEAEFTGLRVRGTSPAELVPLPPSSGTHASALLGRGETLWAAMFGDGLWEFQGRKWRPAALTVPAEAREITALAEGGGSLWLGTRRAGLWEQAGQTWRRHRIENEPYSDNIQSLAAFRGELWGSTLEDGLVRLTRAGWEHYTAPELSSAAPRQMVVFQDRLYVRHGSGQVDQFDGATWTRDVWRTHPRRQAFALAVREGRLYAGRWGGWSEWDGSRWSHHLQVDDLQGRAPTTLLPDGPRLWFGTQGRGLAEVERATGQVRWHDERHGLPDDWITALGRAEGRLYAGTFLGGAASYDGARWTPTPGTAGRCVTAVTEDPSGKVVLGTRTGLVLPAGPTAPVRRPLVDGEVQALLAEGSGLWVGSRAGLAFLTWSPPAAAPNAAGPALRSD